MFQDARATRFRRARSAPGDLVARFDRRDRPGHVPTAGMKGLPAGPKLANDGIHGRFRLIMESLFSLFGP